MIAIEVVVKSQSREPAEKTRRRRKKQAAADQGPAWAFVRCVDEEA